MENLCKFLVRIAIVFTAIYFISTYALANLGILYTNDAYVILMELCVCVFCHIQGKYHCKYIRYTAWSILFCDTLTRLDNSLDFLSVEAHNLIPIFILSLSMIIPFILAINHFHKVRKLNKQKRNIREHEIRR